MSAHMKKHPINDEKGESYKVVIEMPGEKRRLSFLSVKHLNKLEAFLAKYGQAEAPLWEVLAADRIAKYKKSGLVLRGARYREGISQKELAHRSLISQDNISKMENGLRPIGKTVAKRLAKALNIDFHLFLENS